MELQRNRNWCHGQAIGNCYYNSINYGLGLQFILSIHGNISWSLNCKDTESYEKWIVEDNVNFYEDTMLTVANPILCGMARNLIGPHRMSLVTCPITSATNIISSIYDKVNEIISLWIKIEDQLSSMTEEELAAICIAGKKI